MKLFLFTVGLFTFSTLGSTNPVSSEDTNTPYLYIHSGGSDCDSTYKYVYNLTSSSQPTSVKFSVDLVVHKDPEVPNAILFWFKDYEISEFINSDQSTPSNDLSPYPVRVTYRDDGLIEKVEYDDRETDASYHLKNGIVRTLQLPWADIQKAARGDGEAEFSVNLPRSKGSCHAQTKVTVRSAEDFCVGISRKFSDCTGAYSGNTYEKFMDSTKEWHFHFNEENKNLHHAKVIIETFNSAEETINIKTGFTYEGCAPFEGADWSTEELKEIVRKFKIPQKE